MSMVLPVRGEQVSGNAVSGFVVVEYLDMHRMAIPCYKTHSVIQSKNAVCTNIKHRISGQFTHMVKGCMDVLPLVIKEH